MSHLWKEHQAWCRHVPKSRGVIAKSNCRVYCFNNPAYLDKFAYDRHISLMAIRKIARMGHPILGGTAKSIEDPTAPEIGHLIREMLDTMEDAQGAGLAAPQVYENKRLVLFHAPPERVAADDEPDESDAGSVPLTILINPEIEILSQEMEDGWEGCLSVPGMRGLVPRYTHIRYSGVDNEGRLIEREARGFHARVVQHECDHLEGILYPQRMTDLSNLIFESEGQHWMAAEDVDDETDKA